MRSKPDKVNAFFSVYLILLATLGPEVYSASERNEYQKQKKNVSVWTMWDPEHLTTL
jgi:hypothetical protein